MVEHSKQYIYIYIHVYCIIIHLSYYYIIHIIVLRPYEILYIVVMYVNGGNLLTFGGCVASPHCHKRV